MNRKKYYRRRRRGGLNRANNYCTELIKLAPYTITVTNGTSGAGEAKGGEISCSRGAMGLGSRNFDDFYQFRIKKYMVKITAQEQMSGHTDWTVHHPQNIVFFQDPFNQVLEQSAAALQQNVEMLPLSKKCHYMVGVKKGVPVLPHTQTVTSSGAISTSTVEVIKRAQYHPTGVPDALNYYLTSVILPPWTNESWDLPELTTPDNQPDNTRQQKYRVEIWVIANFRNRKPIGA